MRETGGGIGSLGVLCILFIGLKLGGVIDWSWWWVLCPLWGPLAFVVLIVLLVLAVMFMAAAFMWLGRKIRTP